MRQLTPEAIKAYINYELALAEQPQHQSPEAQERIAANIGEAVLLGLTEVTE